MKEQMKELQKLKGIGEVLSRRLVESSYNTIAKVAAAEKKGLERIVGMNLQTVRFIVTQARKMTGEAEKRRHTWSKDVPPPTFTKFDLSFISCSKKWMSWGLTDLKS